MSKPIIHFDEAAHAYTVNGRPVPSVTTVIKEVIGSGFEHLQNAEFYLQRGRAVHACAKFIAEGKDFEHDPAIAGHVAALRKWYADVRPEVIYCEQAVGSGLYGYAGTLDLLAVIGGLKVIVDFKNSMSLERLKIQVGGYSLALKETTGVLTEHGLGVELSEDGTYKTSPLFALKRPRNEFLALLTAYNIKARVGALSINNKE